MTVCSDRSQWKFAQKFLPIHVCESASETYRDKRKKLNSKSSLCFPSEHTLIVFVEASVPTAAAPLPYISQSLWIPVWLEQLLSQHCPLSCLSPSQNTRLFCFWILVNIFIQPWGVLHNDLWRGVINNICPILVSLHIAAGSGRERRRVSPIPEIHLNLCANNMQGKGHI